MARAKKVLWKNYTFADGYRIDVRGGFGKTELAAEERRHGKCLSVTTDLILWPAKAVRP